MTELVEWIDKNDKVLGVVPLKKAHGEFLLHKIAVVYVVNSDGQILVQERLSGRLDHSAAGHVDPGESYEQAAKRELCEELGICGVELLEIGESTVNAIEPDNEKRSKERKVLRRLQGLIEDFS